jgi:hypothetical protein
MRKKRKEDVFFFFGSEPKKKKNIFDDENTKVSGVLRLNFFQNICKPLLHGGVIGEAAGEQVEFCFAEL